MRKTAFFVALASVLSVFAVQVGCSDKGTAENTPLPDREKDSGSSGSSGSSGDPDTGAPANCDSITTKVSDTPSCDTCAKQKCCDSIQQCEKSPDCKALQVCLSKCANDDFTCILTCQEGHDKGGGILQDLGSCAQSECTAECPDETPDGSLFGDGF